MVVLRNGIWKHELVNLTIKGEHYTDEDFGVIIPEKYVEMFEKTNFSTRAYFIEALELASKAEIEEQCGDPSKALAYEDEMRKIMASGAEKGER